MTEKEFLKIKKCILKNTGTELNFTGRYKWQDIVKDFELWKYSFQNKYEGIDKKKLNIKIQFKIFCFIKLLRKHYFIDGNKRFAFEYFFQNVVLPNAVWIQNIKQFNKNILEYIKILENFKDEGEDAIFKTICFLMIMENTKNGKDGLEKWHKTTLQKLAKEE